MTGGHCRFDGARTVHHLIVLSTHFAEKILCALVLSPIQPTLYVDRLLQVTVELDRAWAGLLCSDVAHFSAEQWGMWTCWWWSARGEKNQGFNGNQGSQAVEMVVGWVGEVCKRTSQSERFQHPIDTSILEHAIMPFLGIDRVESVRLGGQTSHLYNRSWIECVVT